MSGDDRFSSWEAAVRWLREQPNQVSLVRDAYYDDPLVEVADRYWRSEEWSAVTRLLPFRCGRALDVGAGRGIASYALAREGFSVMALEPDSSALVGSAAVRQLQAETQLPIEVCEDFSETLPFGDGSFDLVFARAVLHHTRDLFKACSEFSRVLRPGGHFIALREHVISRHSDLEAFHGIHPLHQIYGGEHAFLLAEYQAALRSAGFVGLRTIAPFDSSVNFAPYSLRDLQERIAERATFGVQPATRVLAILLGIMPVWSLVRPLLNHMDKRPGRLYSFVAERR